MNMGATLVMNMGTTQTFELPEGWTTRKVVTALAREWLVPLRPEALVKSGRWHDRWTVQPIVEVPANAQPLWEAGTSTAAYEDRLERPDLVWTVQARTGRSRSMPNSIVLARLSVNPIRPTRFDMVCSQGDLPETLLDPGKVAAFLETHGHAGAAGLFACLLIDHGFRVAVSDGTRSLP
ncbi:MAG TPA: hypothetical protein VD973_03845 [Symbiobacteriaceae bacterium]|nr:hypothetical protein [Symbiobacteriaceae bacterium]